MYVFLDEIENFDAKTLRHSEKQETPGLLPQWVGDEDFEFIENFSTHIHKPVILSEEPQKITSVIPACSFVKDILNSYASLQSIQQQFLLDVHRSKLYINNKPVDKELAALNYILYTFGEQASEYLALCTQATCASAFEWLHFSLPEGYYLTEIDYTEKKEKQSKIFIVHENQSGTNNTIQYQKALQIIRLVTSADGNCTEKKIQRKVFLKISIDLNSKRTGDTTITIHLQ